jgi:tryptophan-rich sensory protein
VALGAAGTAAAAAVAVAAVGGTLTRIGPWYRALKKPAWTPPDLAFPVIWTTIFALTAVAGLQAWRKAPGPRAQEWVIGLLALNGFLNILWSLLFFTLQRPDLALYEGLGLMASVAVPMIVFWRYSRSASLLLTPYLLWVAVALLLNQAIIHLNRPFQ